MISRFSLPCFRPCIASVMIIYAAVAPLVAARIGAAQTVLDVGCGPGILTTFYAEQSPHIQFVGIDRSAASIATARERAEQTGFEKRAV